MLAGRQTGRLHLLVPTRSRLAVSSTLSALGTHLYVCVSWRARPLAYLPSTKKAARERIKKPTASHHRRHQQHQHQQRQRIRAVKTLGWTCQPCLHRLDGVAALLVPVPGASLPTPPPNHGRPIPTRRPHAPTAVRAVRGTVLLYTDTRSLPQVVDFPGRARRSSNGQGPVPGPGMIRLPTYRGRQAYRWHN